jgi:hypothetical protein
MAEEIWKPCTLNPGYEVSSLGRLKNLDGRINDRKCHSTGYIRVYIAGIGIRPLHVLVALAFIPNPDPSIKIWVNHINGIRHDNRIANLEWVSPSENNQRRVNKPNSTAKNPNRYTDLSGEVWNDLLIDDISHRASNYGRIELPSGTKTYGSLTADGYMSIIIGDHSAMRVHRLVCTAFHGNAPTPEHIVNHKDYNKKNNRPENLEWVSQRENILHSYLIREKVIGHNRRRVEQWTKDQTQLIATYDDIITAAKETGANRSAIVQLLRKHPSPSKKTAGGFFWKYAS